MNNVLARLNNLETIRSRAHQLLALAKEDKLNYFSLHQEKMAPTASFIMDVITKNYPTLDIPYHSRWRHFEVGGLDRISKMMATLSHLPAKDQGKILYELVIISVFLDAGAGARWRYWEEESQQYYTRSEGLALASLKLYQSGMLSSMANEPFRVDAQKLIEFTETDLSKAFQVTQDNPLEGLKGRVALLNHLGRIVKTQQACFGEQGRLGDFYSYVLSLAKEHSLSAINLFEAVLKAFNRIWPQRLSYEGTSLGDVWIHSALKTEQAGSEFMPFHKLSQWLSYSLIEPLEQTGIQVQDIDKLTGLPEYRNGGLLIDTGLLSLKDEAMLTQAHEPSSELIVEWRALTVALLDELAQLIRQQLHKDALSLPLAKILQGGTWEAGRQIAKQKREGGTPPLQIISDGTVF
ncbi:URC4/urg3 family protein [Legionella sp. km772]|uniref:URC4/urg3 family protein n=1 Tax=Legionella sp. km772 TaxID=2498111 RepID=UPI001F180A14|nr:URC4/urg3 family protein [Legionella sp. km772]